MTMYLRNQKYKRRTNRIPAEQNGSLSAYDTGITVAKEDELLSLSTCEYSSTGRWQR